MTSLSYKVSTSPPLPTPPPEDEEGDVVSNTFLPPPPPPRRLAKTPPPPMPFQPRRGSLWDFVKSEATGAWDSVGSLARSKEGVESFHPTELPLEAAKAARILRSFTMESIDFSSDNTATEEQQQKLAKKAVKEMKKIPPSAMEHCQGIAIFTVMRTGFLVSGAGGSGVVLARLPDGSWSPPSGILIHTIGFGVVAGADVYDVVLLLRTTKAVKSFSHPRLTLGGELSISQGPYELGANGAGLRVLETGVEISPVWSYVKSKSSYGGVSVDGNVVIERNDENERAYGRQVSSLEILDGAVPAPDWTSGLHQTILAAEGKDFSPALIPSGVSPSEGLSPRAEEYFASSSSSSVSSFPSEPSPASLSVRRASSSTSSYLAATAPTPVLAPIKKLPQEDLDDEDLAAQREMEAMLKEFGIENPNINKETRDADPLLVRGNSHSNKTSFVDHTPPLTPPEKKIELGNEGVEEPSKEPAGLGLAGFGDYKISAGKPEEEEKDDGAKEEETSTAEPEKVEATQELAKKDVEEKKEEEASEPAEVKTASEAKEDVKTPKEKSGDETEDEDEEDKFENFETPTVEQEESKEE